MKEWKSGAQAAAKIPQRWENVGSQLWRGKRGAVQQNMLDYAQQSYHKNIFFWLKFNC